MSNESTEAGAHGRFGYVSVYDPERHMARIEFPDKENLVSGWLPVAVPNSKKNHDECHLDVGEHVYCNMMGNGLESGVVLCAVYDDKNKPPAGDADIRKTTYDDGTQILYDRKNKLLKVECEGDIEIHAKGHIKLFSDEDIETHTDKGTVINASQGIELSASSDIALSSSADISLGAAGDLGLDAGGGLNFGGVGDAVIRSQGALKYIAPRIELN